MFFPDERLYRKGDLSEKVFKQVAFARDGSYIVVRV
jgi:hypothetical protein